MVVLGLEGILDFAMTRQGEGGRTSSPAMPLFSIYRMKYSFVASCLIWWKKVEGKLFLNVSFALYVRSVVVK